MFAIGYSPAYLAENADGIRQDWPRIPLPDSKAVLLASAKLGKQVAALLDTESPLPGVADGGVRPELKTIAVLSSTSNLCLTAGWGHAGQNGVTMPGKGKLSTKVLNADPEYKLPWFEFHDIYLNESVCWRDIPAQVWEYKFEYHCDEKKANALAADGWELMNMGVTSFGSVPAVHCAFKHPK